MPYTVYSYPGFGDQTVVFGIIKEIAKNSDKVIYRSDWMSKINFENRKRLYAGIKNVEVIEEPIETGVTPIDWFIAFTPWWFKQMQPWLQDPSLPYHCNLPKPDWFTENMISEKHWYSASVIPFHKKWDNFFFHRDMKREQEVYYDIFGLKDNQQYIFLQEDPAVHREGYPERKPFLIDRNYIDDCYRVVELSQYPEVSILDTLYTVEKAKEVHTFNTGFMVFVDQMNTQTNNLNLHLYCRTPFWDQPFLRLNWNLIK